MICPTNVVFGNDLYPKSPNQCFSLLKHCNNATHTRSVRTTPPPAPTPFKQDDEALGFAQGSNRKSTSTLKAEGLSKSLSSSSTLKQQVMNVCCKSCGKLGHTSSVCPDSKSPPTQIHAMLTVDDAYDASVDGSVTILTQMHDKFINDTNSPILRQR
jgi:hypothetical protein